MFTYYLLQFAALLNSSDKNDIAPSLPTSEGTIVKDILNGVYFWAGAIAVIIIIVGGVLYMTSAGDSTKMTRAKNAIVGACVGLVIIVMAFTITGIVSGGF